MKVMVAGADGQLGIELGKTHHLRWDSAETQAPELFLLTIDDLDITDRDRVLETVSRIKPDWIINAAAYTAVDKAEEQSELASRVNAAGAGFLAEAARQQGARMVQVSTDFIFDGQESTPYKPDAQPGPLSVYGETKLAGESQVKEALGSQAIVIRTAWVYALEGSNFVHTMLRLMKEKDSLSVVADQIGSPTWARDLAFCIWALIEKGTTTGTFHFTNAGVCSWYDFAVAIQEEGKNHGLLTDLIPVNPIPAKSYPTPAKRPSYGVLDKESMWQELGYVAPHWRVSLRNMISEIAVKGNNK